jgi:hypothetical protein
MDRRRVDNIVEPDVHATDIRRHRDNLQRRANGDGNRSRGVGPGVIRGGGDNSIGLPADKIGVRRLGWVAREVLNGVVTPIYHPFAYGVERVGGAELDGVGLTDRRCRRTACG